LSSPRGIGGKNSTSATLNSYRIAKAPTSTSIF
jgi:hypothetical protein